jgi:hypothetical protein
MFQKNRAGFGPSLLISRRSGVRLAICAILWGRLDADSIIENRTNRKPVPDRLTFYADPRFAGLQRREAPPCNSPDRQVGVTVTTPNPEARRADMNFMPVLRTS